LNQKVPDFRSLFLFEGKAAYSRVAPDCACRRIRRIQKRAIVVCLAQTGLLIRLISHSTNSALYCRPTLLKALIRAFVGGRFGPSSAHSHMRRAEIVSAAARRWRGSRLPQKAPSQRKLWRLGNQGNLVSRRRRPRR
jgi:hypothetical protein